MVVVVCKENMEFARARVVEGPKISINRRSVEFRILFNNIGIKIILKFKTT